MPPSGGTVPGENGGRRGICLVPGRPQRILDHLGREDAALRAYDLVPGRPQRILDHLGREDAALRAYDPAGRGCARDGL